MVDPKYLALQILAVSSRGSELLRRTRRTQRRRRCIQIATFRAAIIAGFTVQREIWQNPQSKDWWERVVLGTFDDDMWRTNFRMRRGTFERLCDRLAPRIVRQDTPFRQPVPVEKRVAVTLWWLATGSGFRTIAHLFGIGKSSVCEIVHDVCAALSGLRREYIRLPQGDQLQSVVNGFKTKWGFPQCAGAIDGSHIPVIAPSENHTDYFNRKGWHSIILQGVADHKFRFTNINVGWPGSVHDCRVLRNSDIYARAERGTLFPPDTEVICGTAVPIMLLGDPAYPLRSWIMKGYADTGRLTDDQLRFNQRLSRARMTIECTFGRLKGRWRCIMKRLDVDIVNVPNVVTACCVLHNVCEVEGEVFEVADYVQEDNVAQHVLDEPTNGGPHRVREALRRYFNENA